jgi:hypothetical protein
VSAAMFRDPMPLSVPAALVVHAVLRAEEAALVEREAARTANNDIARHLHNNRAKAAQADADALNAILNDWQPCELPGRAA